MSDFAKVPGPNTQVIADRCSKHPEQKLTKLNGVVHINGKPKELKPFCPICTQENVRQRELDGIEKNEKAKIYLKTYSVLKRESTIPKELEDATFDNYVATTPAEVDLLEFFKEQSRKYWKGMTGNTLVTGSVGIGKSHLSVAMAKLLNEQFKKKGEPKSFLFVNMTEIIKQIKAGWNDKSGRGVTEDQVVKRLTSVDYLILDDLGAKNSEIKPRSDWEQDLLFDILDKRQNTIINTNLNAAELRTAFNDRNFSRITKGVKDNYFQAGEIKDKREEL